MTDTTETLLKIAALCGYPQYDCLDQHVPQLLYEARRVLRERGVDVRWYYDTTHTVFWFAHYNNSPTGDSIGHPTEAACICAALESTQPKVEKPKERYTYCLVGESEWYECDGVRISWRDVLALLNAPHYTQADMDALRSELAPRVGNTKLCEKCMRLGDSCCCAQVDEAVAKAWDEAGKKMALSNLHAYAHEFQAKAAAPRKGGAK